MMPPLDALPPAKLLVVPYLEHEQGEEEPPMVDAATLVLLDHSRHLSDVSLT
jgi:hypothetical protein